jgi:hypothetical protein
VLVGTDAFGNKFYENKDELPRTSPKSLISTSLLPVR